MGMSQRTLDLSNISSQIGEAIEIFNFFERGNPCVQRVKVEIPPVGSAEIAVKIANVSKTEKF
jgi:hypothetical protein